ncbi:hypothetical protein [Lysinibacillus fusiformis]|uniref:hypothetical protein n=1 Tax=Lysinibacillus fusiformis TaxID=28031 RepID=UPI0011A7A797|nr:hypothetical protein [Lysinibacillus fusiformis]
MSWGLSPIWAKIISLYTLLIDQKCREDLSLNLLVSERDYVSRFLTHLMYPNGPFNSKSNYIFWKARTNDGSTERDTGTDGVIIFTYKGQYKVSLFEAKWPRYFNKKYNWDNLYKVKKEELVEFELELKNYNADSRMRNKQKFSRFSQEIIKQKSFAHQAAIWEIFFCDAPVGTGNSISPYFNEWGSTCVWFDEAFNHFNYYRGSFQFETWKNIDLEQLFLGVNPGENIPNRSVGPTIAEIIYKILTCQKGKPLDNSNLKGDYIILEGEDIDSKQVNIKIPLFDFSNINGQKFHSGLINDFLETSTFSYYIAVDLERCIQSIIQYMLSRLELNN